MKIVIDIPIVVYDEIINFNDANNTALYEAIRNGTPLHSGHGKLIDSNVLWDAFQDLGQDFYEAFDFAEANAVIEADEDGE